MLFSFTKRPKLHSAGQSQLCHACFTIFKKHFPGRTEPTFPQKLYNSFLDFKASVEIGCDLCFLLWSRLTVEGWNETAALFKAKEPLMNDDFSIKLAGAVVKAIDGEASEVMEMHFHCNLGDGLPTKVWVLEFRDQKDLSVHKTPMHVEDDYVQRASSESPASLNLVLFWLNDCLQNHPNCGPFSSGYHGNEWLPTRLVYVGGASGNVARLCHSIDLPGSTSYATLSHCWGTLPMFTLLSTNMETLQERLPLEKLSKTFQDSLLVCRALGVEYIWIDSLCIIQDSREDWGKESKVMGEVYKRACCNLAATGFRDGRNGMFVERDRRIINPIKIRSERGSKKIKSGDYYISDTALWYDGVVDAPLNERAWVFQERLLSPRIIHFTARQLYWECKQKQACEAFPAGIPVSEWSERMQDRTGRISQSQLYKQLSPIDNASVFKSLENNSSGEIPDAIWDFWNTVVRNYTSFRLTRGSDKLAALSGVAKDMQKFFNCQYLAGIWETDIAPQLLWDTQKRVKGQVGLFNLPRPQEYRAPSWSWACLDSPIQPGRRRTEDVPVIHILEANIDVGSGEMANQVVGGSIRMSGKLTRASWNPKDNEKGLKGGVHLHAREAQGQCMVWTSLCIVPDCFHEWDIRWHDQMIRTKEYLGGFGCTDAGGNTPKDVFILPVLVREKDVSYMEGAERCAVLEGLVLELTGRCNGQFKRVGTFTIQTEYIEWLEGQRSQPTNSDIRDVGSYFYPLIPALEVEEYIAVEDGGCYVFDIV